jgi:hypothetical protein
MQCGVLLATHIGKKGSCSPFNTDCSSADKTHCVKRIAGESDIETFPVISGGFGSNIPLFGLSIKHTLFAHKKTASDWMVLSAIALIFVGLFIVPLKVIYVHDHAL